MAAPRSNENASRPSEPDKLDTYIRVATPGAWMALAAVVCALIALVTWSLLGEVGGVSIFEALFL